MVKLEASEITLAKRVAKTIAARWSLVEREDMTQALLLWLCENVYTVERYRSEGDQGRAKLYTALKRAGDKLAAIEQAERRGAPLNADYKFSTEQVEGALVAMFEQVDASAVLVNPVTGEPIFEQHPRLDEARMIVIQVSDLFELLPDDEQILLVWRYMQELTFREIADISGLSPTGVHKAVKRILLKIQRTLDGLP